MKNIYKRLKGLLSKKLIWRIIVVSFLYFLPLWFVTIVNLWNIKSDINNLETSDAVIVFGTRVNEFGTISPLLRERLMAGKLAFDSGKADKIVVSNTAAAAEFMRKYLEGEGIAKDYIAVGPTAETTPDTCRYEKNKYGEIRKLIFVSQNFHLSRLLFQCKKIGIDGIGFPAESSEVIDRSVYSWWVKIKTRTKRHIREAGLMWLALLNIYK